jgi:tartrate-resistant acid phosphatase type 5
MTHRFAGTRHGLIALIAGCAFGCTASPTAPAPPSVAPAMIPAPAPAPENSPPPGEWGLLIFGDHGYDLRYLERDDYEPPLDRDGFVAKEREEWLEDKRPPGEFEPPAATKHPNGGWVPATGMRPVASAMTQHCLGAARCDFAVMLGDNIYPKGATRGADGHDDATRFERVFRQPFGAWQAWSPDFRIYVTLGNHDWKTSREAAMDQVAWLERTPPFYTDGIVYRVKPPAARGEAELFVIDTSVLLAGHDVYEDALGDDGRERVPTELETPDPWTRPANAAERDMVAWLERSLAESTARWKIVVAHHPLWSSAGSKYEQAKVLRRLIMPALCRYADLYLAGHDHTLELHHDDCREALPGERVAPLPNVVSGAASKQRALNTSFMRHQAQKYPQLRTDWARGLVWGFAHLEVSGDAATLTFVETPDDGSGKAATVYVTRLERRTAGRPQTDR